MSVNIPRVSRLETLPREILYIINGLLRSWEVKKLSRANKRLREVCLPSLFRRVQFRFSKDGFEGLKSLLRSEARYHVVSFTYVVPELLKADILDFDYFRSEILAPNEYVETAKELYDAGGGADECPPYMVIYEAVYDAWKEQRNIVDNGADLAVLSTTLEALPRLTDVGISFCEVIKGEDFMLSTFVSEMIVVEESYEYHVRIVSEAIQRARNRGVAIHTIRLIGFALPYHDRSDGSGLSSLSESLRKLLEPVQVLRLNHSNSALELISHCTLSLHQLDMCRGVAKHNDLAEFLQTNKRSICSIGFHDVRTIGSSQLGGKILELSSSMLCQMLNVSQPTPCRAAACGCFRFQKVGRRLLLNDNRL